jgi:MFS family permease
MRKNRPQEDRLLRRRTNGQVFLNSEAPWSVVGAWMSSYLTLYLVSWHLSARQIGWAMGFAGVLQVGVYPFMGWITDHLGRKAVIQIGDFLGWIVAFVLWTARPVALLVAAAYILNQASAVVTPAWNSLFSEDASATETSTGYMRLQILTILGGISVPILASWIGHVGIRQSGRTVLLTALPFVAAAWLYRQRYLRESSVGESQRLAYRSGKRLAFRTRLQIGLRDQGMNLALLRIVGQVTFALFATFAPLTFVLKKGLDLPLAWLAFLPLATSVFGLALWNQHHRVATWAPRTTLGLSLAVLTGGFFMLALAAPSDHWMVLPAWGLIMTGQSLYWSSHTTYWMTWIPDVARVDVQSVVGAASALLVTILGPALSPTMVDHPHALYWAMVFVSVGLTGLWLLLPDQLTQNSPSRP